MDWDHGSADTARDSETPIVVILPGITGSSQSDYCKALVNIIRDQVGARVAVFNFRGRGGVKVKSPRTYCAANSEDLSEILDYINSTFPRAPVVALGVSLGIMDYPQTDHFSSEYLVRDIHYILLNCYSLQVALFWETT